MDWRKYKNKIYTQNEARKMDYELDLVHKFLDNMYDWDWEHSSAINDLKKQLKRNVWSK
jgi:hypothetical protein